MPRHPRLQTPFLMVVGAALLLLLLLVMPVSLRLLRQAEEQRQQGLTLEQTIALNDTLRSGMHAQIAVAYRYVRRPEPELREAFRSLHFDLGKDQIRYLTLSIGDAERLIVERMRTQKAELEQHALGVFEAAEAGRRDEALERLAAMEEIEAGLNGLFDELAALQTERLRGSLEESLALVSGGWLLLAWMLAGSSLLVAILAWLFRQRILKPVSAMLAASEQVSQGRFDTRSPVHRRDEVGRLAAGLNDMASSLEQIYGRLEETLAERTGDLEEVRQQLVHAERLSAMGQMVSGVAHELNNPLTAVIGFSELLLADPKLSQDVRRKITLVMTQAERCARIVDTLLQFARRKESRRESFLLRDVVQQALELRAYDLQYRGITVVQEHEESCPPVLGDPDKVQQVVLNVLGNAMDALEETAAPGTVWIETSTETGKVVLELRDSGPGFPDTRRIFEPFFTTKDVGKGTGLGLSVCYGIVEEHGGQISADNWEQGARVRIALPVAGEHVSDESGPSVQAEAMVAAPALEPARVLVVDDEETLLGLQASVLEGMGLVPTCVKDGVAAISHLEAFQVDLVISDIRMPGPVDGLGLLEWIQAHRPGLAGRFLFTTGDAARLAAGSQPLPAPCLRKPFTAEQYRKRIRGALAGVPAP